MTDDELRTLVAGLAVATARNTEAVNSLRESIQIQAQSIENIQENLSYNTQIVADGLELAAASNRTAAAAMEFSANTMRAIDKLGIEISDLKQIVGIVINDSRADRSRIVNLEGQN